MVQHRYMTHPCHTYVCNMIMRNTKTRPIDDTMKISSFRVLLYREEEARIKAEELAIAIKAGAFQ
jgi:C4-type Zn-finger protein